QSVIEGPYHAMADEPRDRPEPAGPCKPTERRSVCVSTQEFVGALARKDHSDVVLRELGNVVKRYRGRICDWFFKVPDTARKRRRKILVRYRNLMVVCSVVVCDQPREWALVVFRVNLVGESHRERLDAAAGQLAHYGRHDG